MRHSRGFTLVELLIVLVLIAILTTIAVPTLLRSKMAAHEQAALAALRLLAQAEAHFTASVAADLNHNGIGEYGVFAEISGKLPVRSASGGVKYLDPSLVSAKFRHVTAAGELSLGGYLLRVYLPGSMSDGLKELPGGGADPLVDPDQAETLWCAYAWPWAYGGTGTRTYYVNQSGVFLYTEDSVYSGTAAPIPPGAATLPGGPPNVIDGSPAINAAGRDGNVWHPAGG